MEGFGPDQEIFAGDQILPDDKDPVLLGALHWLNSINVRRGPAVPKAR